MKSDIPNDQLQRIQPIVDQVLTQLRHLCQDFSSQDGMAVDYQPKPEAAE